MGKIARRERVRILGTIRLMIIKCWVRVDLRAEGSLGLLQKETFRTRSLSLESSLC